MEKIRGERLKGKSELELQDIKQDKIKKELETSIKDNVILKRDILNLETLLS